MTASTPSAARAAVDQLKGLLAGAVSPLPWSNSAPFSRVLDGAGSTDNMAMALFDEALDADLAVAAVNALPHLLAAIKAVDELHQEHKDLGWCKTCEADWPCPTSAALALAAVDVTETADGAS